MRDGDVIWTNGITKRWQGVFLDGNVPIAGSEFSVRSVDSTVITGVITGRSELPSRRVRVSELSE